MFDRVTSALSRMDARHFFPEIIGESLAIRGLLSLIMKVAPTDSTVLILGESGTGKELVATSLFENSQRKDKPFVKLNCAAIPAELLESELFGHEKGAFTGATAFKPGKFDMADGGTIFLDEIGDMPLTLQAKILRVLQEKEFYRVGGSRTIRVDVRFIASTNKNLEKMVQEGTFREDLFYRLNVFTVRTAPAARAQGGHSGSGGPFPEKHAKTDRNLIGGPADAHDVCLARQHPGIEEHHRKCGGDCRKRLHRAGPAAVKNSRRLRPGATDYKLPSSLSLDDRLQEIERSIIVDALTKTGGVQTRATELLGINQRSLWHRIKKLNIDVKGTKNIEM